MTQVTLLTPEVLLGLCGDNDEDSVVGDAFIEELVVLLCPFHKNVELCWSLDSDGCRELQVAVLALLEGAQLGFLWRCL